LSLQNLLRERIVPERTQLDPKLRRWFAGLTAFLVLACLSACTPTAPATRPRPHDEPGALSHTYGKPAIPRAREASVTARPPFFRVEGPTGARLSILGTVHVGPASGWHFSPEVDRAIEVADRFVMELDLREADEDAVGSLLASTVLLAPGQTIDEIIAPETAALMHAKDALLARYGMPRNARVRFEPWFVAVSVTQAAATESGYALDRSVENELMERIGDRPLLGLETFDAQIRILDGLPAEAQDAMLRDTLLRLEAAKQELDELVEAWRRADRSALESIAKQGVDALPTLEAFYNALLVRRNADWVTMLREQLDDPNLKSEEVFVAVGALHIVGAEGLEALLRDAGYRVERIH
jgi:uncharacterized protein YbaP (TraB family)